MPPEFWSKFDFATALVIALFTFFTTFVWKYLTSRQNKIDEWRHAKDEKQDAQYTERHNRYIGSIDDVRDSIRESIESNKQMALASLQTQRDISDNLRAITTHLEKSDQAVIDRIDRSERAILASIDALKKSEPRKSTKRARHVTP